MAGGVADDLAWWHAHRASNPDAAVMRDVLARLERWKVQHDEDRARHPPPFLQLAWDAIFGDEDHQVGEAIREIEAALSAR